MREIPSVSALGAGIVEIVEMQTTSTVDAQNKGAMMGDFFALTGQNGNPGLYRMIP